MQHKSIIIIGTFVILSTLVIGFLVYYFSRDGFKCLSELYQCRNSTKCILQKNVCDSHEDCPAGDDESYGNCLRKMEGFGVSFKGDIFPLLRRSKTSLCDLKYCYNNDTHNMRDEDGCLYCWYTYWREGKQFPIEKIEKYPSISNKTDLTHQHLTELGNLNNKTEIYWLDLSKNQIKIIKPGQLTELPVLRYLMIEDNEITHANLSDLSESSELITINLTKNNLTYDNLILPCNPRVEFLILPSNLIERIKGGFLSGLPGLRYLDLSRNHLHLIDRTAFNNMTELAVLLLNENELVTLADNVFSSLRKLVLLELSNNKIETIKSGQLRGLPALRDISLDNNKITRANLSDLSESSELTWINLIGNNLTHDNLNLPCNPQLEIVNLANNSIERISDLFPLFCFPNLTSLDLSGNRISLIDRTAFNNLTGLTSLHLADNSIERISDVFSSGPSGLAYLDLSRNRLRLIDRSAFNNLTELEILLLRENELETLPENVFNSLENLRGLSIAHNPIKNLPFATLSPLRKILMMDLRGINMEYTENGAFDKFQDLLQVHLTEFHDCLLYAPNVRECIPVRDGISSPLHLLKKPVLRYAIWGISAITCLGNMLVLWERFTAKDENRVLSISIKNLAVADMLMGIYLIVIAVEDIYSRDNYLQKANSWISSWSCIITGMLAMISCIVSDSILSFISIERFMLITSFENRYSILNPRTTIISMIIIWGMGITIAIIPVIYWGNTTKYYGINGMCFPLHIDDPFLIGWQYSAFIFICFNSFGIFIIAYVYVRMFFSIRETRRNTTLPIKDSEFVIRFFLIVLTNTACFVPIMILRILSLTNHPVPSDLYEWMVIFVLPVNSAVNPLLYTLTTTRFKERLDKGVEKLWRLLRKNS